jgi:hypothetical protein
MCRMKAGPGLINDQGPTSIDHTTLRDEDHNHVLLFPTAVTKTGCVCVDGRVAQSSAIVLEISWPGMYPGNCWMIL